MTLAIFFILGLIIGSFLNVLVYRIRAGEGIFWGRSKCPHCKNTIRWYDNIPLISFFLLKAECRDCGKNISWQYPLVESFAGFVFAAIGYKFFESGNGMSWLIVAYYLVIASVLIAIFVYDWRHMEIPTAVLWVGIAAAAVWELAILAMSGNFADFGGKTLGATAAFLFFFFLAYFSKEKWMGMGDAYLAILLGLFLGWPEAVLAVFASFFIGSIYGIIIIAAGRKKMQSRIPFAPFLVIGTFISLFFYEQIIEWYFSLF